MLKMYVFCRRYFTETPFWCYPTEKINASHIYNLKILVAILKSFKTPGKINFLTYLTQLYKNIEIL